MFSNYLYNKNLHILTLYHIENRFFVLVDNLTGIQIFNYTGRPISQPKYAGLRSEFITPQNISISSDILAIKDHKDEKGLLSCHPTTFKLI